jgi:predicted PurR-regulated permease PerM
MSNRRRNDSDDETGNGIAKPCVVPTPVSRPLPLCDLAKRVVVAVLVTVLILLLFYVLGLARHVLLQAFAGVLFAILLATVSSWLSRQTGLSNGWSLTAVVIGLCLVTVGSGWLLANRLVIQFNELTAKLPESLQQLREHLEQSALGQFVVEQVDRTGGEIGHTVEWGRVLGILSGISGFLVATVVIIFVGIFGAAEAPVYRAGVLHLVPRPARRRAGEALDAVVYNLRWWMVGQILLMVIIGASTTVGLWLIGIPLALTLGIIAGIMELVPYVGPWLSAVPALLLALLISPGHLIMVAVLYLGLHILEGYVVLPLLQNRITHVPPALTLVAQAALGEMFGLMGLFLAAPLTVAVLVILKIFYVEDTLGDRAIEVAGAPDQENKVAARSA